MLPDLFPQIPLTATNAPLTTRLSKAPDEIARSQMQAVLSVETLGNVVAWVGVDGWHYQIEAPPKVTISPGTQRASVTIDLRVWDAENMLMFLDRIEITDGFPVLIPDGTQHKETQPDGTTRRVDNFRESPLEAARAKLARIVRTATANGRHIREENIGH